MGFYLTTENPCVKVRENHITKSCEYIIIYHDELYSYIALTTLEEILHISQEKYNMEKLNINDNMLSKQSTSIFTYCISNYQVTD